MGRYNQALFQREGVVARGWLRAVFRQKYHYPNLGRIDVWQWLVKEQTAPIFDACGRFDGMELLHVIVLVA